MFIAVDAMGGDHAPREVVSGAVQVAREQGTQILLVGNSALLESELRRLGASSLKEIEIVHAEEVVGMDEPAVTPLRKKKRSSIRICADLVKKGRAQAMVSAGNTGAVMISAKMVLGTIEGVDRPALAAEFPNPQGRTVVLDVGANVDTKPSQLREFAVMGHFYSQEINGIHSPRIGLMSIGEEETKGTGKTRVAFQVLQETGLNFVGNVEGRDVFSGSVDVIVCDGFVGNVLLKSAEAVAELIKTMLRRELQKSPLRQIGALLARPAFEDLAKRTDYREYGAAPLLGLRGGCFIAHGRSNSTAIKNSIRRAEEFVAAETPEKIRAKVAQLHNEEKRLLGDSEL
ncbi:MAG: phosphate acyltransferase PlsX [Deltaproteobacteria bacterium]|nr:phosphate acyltransferase PlsX [Deltaproteobacteria bacterium]